MAIFLKKLPRTCKHPRFIFLQYVGKLSSLFDCCKNAKTCCHSFFSHLHPVAAVPLHRQHRQRPRDGLRHGLILGHAAAHHRGLGVQESHRPKGHQVMVLIALFNDKLFGSFRKKSLLSGTRKHWAYASPLVRHAPRARAIRITVL